MPTTGVSLKQSGYVVAILINVAMLVIVQNILEWGWLPFLTDDFATVIPWLSAAFVVSIGMNFVYQLDDSRAVKSVGQIAVNVMSAYSTFALLKVFPFDFSNYAFDWAPVARILLILAIVGAAVGSFVEVIKLLTDRLGRDGVFAGEPGQPQPR